MEEENNVIDINMDLGQVHVLMDLFDEILLVSPSNTKKVYDYVIKPDYLYIETVNGTVYRIHVKHNY